MDAPETEIINGVAVLVFRRSGERYEVLLMKRATERYGGEWFPVEGMMDDGEGPTVAALRELGEETQLTPVELFVAPSSPLLVTSRNNQVLIHVFIVVVDLQSSVVLNEEHSEYKWFDFEEADRMLPLESQRSALAEVSEILRRGKSLCAVPFKRTTLLGSD